MIGIILAASISVSPFCGAMGNFAETVMTSRQNGETLNTVLRAYKDAYIRSNLDNTSTSFTLTILSNTYDVPLVAEKDKQAFIKEYGNITRAACSKSGL